MQLQGSDLQQHQGAGQTLLAHFRMGPDQIPRIPGHDPQVRQSTRLTQLLTQVSKKFTSDVGHSDIAKTQTIAKFVLE